MEGVTCIHNVMLKANELQVFKLKCSQHILLNIKVILMLSNANIYHVVFNLPKEIEYCEG